MAKEKKVWCQRDQNGCWVCPFCFDVLVRIDITSQLARAKNAPRMIADHLVDLCQKYTSAARPAMNDGTDTFSMGVSSTGSVEEDIPLLTSQDELAPLAGSDSGELLSLKGPARKERKTGAWGRDGQLAAAEHGMTLKNFGKSGEIQLISDDDVPELSVGSGHTALTEFRREINQDMGRLGQYHFPQSK